MTYYNRRSIRLRGYDYSQNGLSFCTICVQHTGQIMGLVPGAHTGAPLQMVLNDVGKMMECWWNKIPGKFPGVELDVYQIMPNHLHGIIHIVGADPCVRPLPNPCVRPLTLGNVIQWFKTMTTNEYIKHVKNGKWIPFPIRLWQRNFYEHIIRDEDEYNKICYYIQNNPQMWDRDRNNLTSSA